MWYIKNSTSITLYLKISPGAKQNKFLGLIELYTPNLLKLSIKALPEKHAANKELVNFLSSAFKIPKQNISIIKGKTANIKTIKVITNQIDHIIDIINNQLQQAYVRDNQLPFV